ncbi:DUF1161 domain-containing protein [Variovorax paradoxus]|nr:DUF1161 domain-containing protein [Variovorax paradoxus]
MRRLFLAAVALVVAGSASGAAGNCDALLSEIDAKIRADRFTLSTVNADATVAGKVVGSCELGTKKIVYVQEDSPASSSPPRPGSEPIMTECKDGSVSVGGDCRK